MADDPWAAEVSGHAKASTNGAESLSQKVDQIQISGGRGRGRGRGLAARKPPTTSAEPPPVGNHDAGSATANAAAKTKEEPSTDQGKALAEDSLLQKMLRKKMGLIQTKAELQVQQKDPNSPLYSVKSFESLNIRPELLRGIYAMGFNCPSKIQETALPALLANPPANMIAQSQSGTGKTAAFVLTMLSRVDLTKNYTQCLCLAPTYELALQIGSVTKEMAKFLPDLKIRYGVRGGEKVYRNQTIDSHIVIGTPGTLLDWCLKFKVIDLKKVNVFVLDEADVMIAQQGHQDQSIRIKMGLRPDCQMLLFSATYDQAVMAFAVQTVSDAILISLKREELSLDNIKQYYIECQSEQAKYDYLCNIYGAISIGQSMIFCRTKKTASWLSESMTKDGHAVALLSGELTVEQRAAVIDRFRDGKEKVLITTNVSARGIDVEQVTVVCNFDLPTDMRGEPDYETYLHRIGRTGRFGKQGLAINMIDSARNKRVLDSIEKHFGRQIVKLDASDIEEIEKIQN